MFQKNKAFKENLRPEFFMEAELEVQKQFRNKFTEPHRLLKRAIHLCQYQAYNFDDVLNNNTGSNKYLDAEKEAKNCFLPMLIIRRHAQVILSNSYNDFQDCLNQVDTVNKLENVSSD